MSVNHEKRLDRLFESSADGGVGRRTFLKAALAVPLALWGCQGALTATEVVTAAAVISGDIDPETADAINASAKAIAHTFKAITPRQEYFIGRAVGAVILDTYPVWEDEAATRYVNLLGHSLAVHSSRPETFGGYHFLLLDSDDINGLAAPGGLIFLTRGLLRCCTSEAALAGVLAHEIGHVAHQHGLQAIKASRITEAVISVGATTSTVLDVGELNELTEIFGGSIDDISRTLVKSGYSREFETEADEAAVAICERVGYSAAGLVDALMVMDTLLEPGASDFSSTHPSPTDRIADIKRAATSIAATPTVVARAARFEAAFAGA